MPTVLTVVGARPNFVKAAPVMGALARLDGVRQRLVHTGQHYDAALSGVFFDELGLPRPDHHLGVGSGSHAEQTAAVLVGVERVLRDERPDALVAVGDVNSTLAAALAAAKLGVPVVHLEAGVRSFDRAMPEEINRIVVDHLADLLLAPTATGATQLAREGIDPERVVVTGNVTIDTLFAQRAHAPWDDVRAAHAVVDRGYAVLTLHRPANVDDPARLRHLVATAAAALAPLPVIFPVHPRTARQLEAHGIAIGDRIRVTAPLGYRAFLALMDHAAAVVTDSGGIQAETTALGVPCFTTRDTTEWPETIATGTNALVGADGRDLVAAVTRQRGDGWPAVAGVPLWDGRAGERAAAAIHRWLQTRRR